MRRPGLMPSVAGAACLLALCSCSCSAVNSGVGGVTRGATKVVGTATSPLKGLPFGKKKGQAEQEAPPPAQGALGTPAMQLPVGTVHFLHPDGEFVLIRSSRASQVEEGTMLTVYGPGGAPTARLEASPARQGGFLTADLIEGRPSVGDQVLREHVMEMPGAAGAGPVVQVLE